MAVNVKIVDASHELSIFDLVMNTVYIPVGRKGHNISENVKASTLKTYFNESRDRIISGNTIARVYNSGNMKIIISGTDKFLFTNNALLPKTDNIDLGDSSIPFNNLNLSKGINVGNDSLGDIYYRDNNNKFQRLPIGSTGQVLTVLNNIPSWGNNSGIINSGKESLRENVLTTINFSYPYSTRLQDSKVVVVVSAYDSRGNSVVVNVTNITIYGFKVEASVAATLHYISNVY